MANNILRGLIEETGSNTNGAQKRPREAEDEGPVKKYVCILYSIYIREAITEKLLQCLHLSSSQRVSQRYLRPILEPKQWHNQPTQIYSHNHS